MKTHTQLRTQRVLPARIAGAALRESWPRSCSCQSAGGKSSRSLRSCVVWLLCKRRCKVTTWIPCQNHLWRCGMCTTKISSGMTSSCRSWDSSLSKKPKSALLWRQVFVLLPARQLKENITAGVSHCLFPFSLGVQADCWPLVLLLWLASGHTGLCSEPTCNIPEKISIPKGL